MSKWKKPISLIILQILPAEKIGSPSEGAAGGGCGGNSAAPERSAGAKRRRSVSLKIGSDFVKQTHQNISLGSERVGVLCFVGMRRARTAEPRHVSGRGRVEEILQSKIICDRVLSRSSAEQNEDIFADESGLSFPR